MTALNYGKCFNKCQKLFTLLPLNCFAQTKTGNITVCAHFFWVLGYKVKTLKPTKYKFIVIKTLYGNIT